MRTVKNLSSAPLRVPLPAGKTLHLGPGQSGSVRDSAVDHPSIKALCESGALEVGEVTSSSGQGTAGASSMRAGAGGLGQSGTRRQSGDR